MGSSATLWILIIGTLVGTLLGGLIGLVNTRMQSKIQIKRERERLILGKLEELHQVVSQFKQAYWDLFLMASSHAAVEALIKQHSAIPTEKLEMLVGFYAPELSTSFESIKSLSGEYDKALAQFINWQEKDEETRQSVLSEAARLKEKLDQTCEKVQAEAVALSRKYI
jgi:hypothetical protein